MNNKSETIGLDEGMQMKAFIAAQDKAYEQDRETRKAIIGDAKEVVELLCQGQYMQDSAEKSEIQRKIQEKLYVTSDTQEDIKNARLMQYLHRALRTIAWLEEEGIIEVNIDKNGREILERNFQSSSHRLQGGEPNFLKLMFSKIVYI